MLNLRENGSPCVLRVSCRSPAKVLDGPPATDDAPRDDDDCDDQEDPGDVRKGTDHATKPEERENQQQNSDDENDVHGMLRDQRKYSIVPPDPGMFCNPHAE